MKGEIPKPIIALVVVVCVVIAGLWISKSFQPIPSEVVLPDAGNMSADDIAKLKNQDHAADEQRARG